MIGFGIRAETGEWGQANGDMSQIEMDMSQTRMDMSQTRMDMSQTELDMSQTRMDMSPIGQPILRKAGSHALLPDILSGRRPWSCASFRPAVPL